MRPPAQTPVSIETIRSIAHRHRLQADSSTLQRWVGGGSCVYQLGGALVLKVPHDDPAPIASLAIEAIAASAAHAAGVRTPRLIVLDDSLDHLPVPYLVYERVVGRPLSQLVPAGEASRPVWRAVGGDLARLHTRVGSHESLRLLPTFEHTPDTDPRPWVAHMCNTGALTAAQARWLGDVLERLAPTALAPNSPRVCHGDVNAANVMVGARDPGTYAALLDWGGAGWADPASEFAPIPLPAVPFVLSGYRDIAPLEDDSTAESRILWFYVRLAFFTLRRATMTPGERAERIERLLKDTRVFLRSPQLG